MPAGPEAPVRVRARALEVRAHIVDGVGLAHPGTHVDQGAVFVLPHVTLLPVASCKRLPETSGSAMYASSSISMINF
jgi:hypothetical protein